MKNNKGFTTQIAGMVVSLIGVLMAIFSSNKIIIGLGGVIIAIGLFIGSLNK